MVTDATNSGWRGFIIRPSSSGVHDSHSPCACQIKVRLPSMVSAFTADGVVSANAVNSNRHMTLVLITSTLSQDEQADEDE